MRMVWVLFDVMRDPRLRFLVPPRCRERDGGRVCGARRVDFKRTFYPARVCLALKKTLRNLLHYGEFFCIDS